MADVTLSSAVRSSLLSLQNTTRLIDRTQGRLSTGLRVASSIDDPVAFFQAKTLNDRAFDFNEKKDGIDQGVSTVSAALEGIESIENVVRQLKGVATNLKSATGAQFTDLVTQFNSLRTQIGSLADDASFQGVNLVNNTTDTLSVSFSEKTSSLLSVNAVNVRESGLGIDAAIHASGIVASVFNFAADTSNNTLSGGETITVTYQGTARTIDTASTLTFTYGTVSIAVKASTQGTISLSAGDVITLNISSDADEAGIRGTGVGTGEFYGEIAKNGVLGPTIEFAANTSNNALSIGETITVTFQGSSRTIDSGTTLSFTFGTVSISIAGNTVAGQAVSAGDVFTLTLSSGVGSAAHSNIAAIGNTGFFGVIAANGLNSATITVVDATAAAATGIAIADVAANVTNYVVIGNAAQVNAVIAELDSALTTLRSNAQTLGSNVALLQTRLDFTETYVNTLETGAAKLTLADINEEGANLLALQTRQQLGISALAFAGQAEQGILSLFR
ncbi:MAG: flagellin-like protein [Proteobacteria bacterium]|nr:flagellin-like protein [Pseudomonadota bacterium]